MSKPMVYTVPCGDNEVSDGEPIIQDGAGAMEAVSTSGVTFQGIASTDKDAEDNVAMITKGLKKLRSGSYTTWNVGEKLGMNTVGVHTYSSGTILGRAAETKSTAIATSDLLLVEIDINNA